MSTTFCPACMKDTDVHIEDRRETLPVRGEDIEVDARVAVCSVCGDDVWLDESRTRRLPSRSPSTAAGIICCSRKRWSASAGSGGSASGRSHSSSAGANKSTLHRYENGSLQDGAHDAQLRMAERPENVRTLLESNGDRLTLRQRDAVTRRLEQAEAIAAECECRRRGL